MSRRRSLPSLLLALALGLSLSACPTTGWRPPTDPAPGDGAPPPRQPRATAARTQPQAQPQYQPQAPPAARQDDPRISTSRGAPGGVVLLWPRVIPSARTVELRQIAQPLHQRLFNLVQAALPGRHIDIRPEPQRVCPQAGCEGVAVGVLLLSQGQGCVAVVQISRPGRSPARQIAWAGDVSLRQVEVPFRDPPETHVLVKDYASCQRVVDDTRGRDDQVKLAIAAAASAR